METNETQAAINAGMELVKIQRVGEAPIAILPNGCRAEILNFGELEKHRDVPYRVRGTFSFGEVHSFNRYVKAFDEGSAAIFASTLTAPPSFKAVLNFHQVEGPSWNDHVATHALVETQEWKVWNANNRKQFSQSEFATFLEENAGLFQEPTGAHLMDLISELEGHADVSVNSSVKNRTTGAIQLTYSEDVILKGVATNKEGQMELPSILTAGIAPFEGVSPYLIKARLRYRIASRKITFWYEAIDQHVVIKDVIKGILAKIEEQTGIKPYIV